MSIADNPVLYKTALRQAHTEFPPLKSYRNKPSECNHNFSFIIYCDGGDWDIARCQRCGSEKIIRCTFDDDYD